MAVKTITGKLTGPSNAAIGGVLVTAQLSASAVIAATQEIAPLAVTTQTATDGTWSLSLQANGDLTPGSTYYTVSVGPNWTATAIVPQTAGPFLIENIMAVAPAAWLGGTAATINPAGDIAARSFTALANGPYASDFPAGGTNPVAAGESSIIFDKGGLVYNLNGPKYRALGTWDPVAGTGDATTAFQQAVTDIQASGKRGEIVGAGNLILASTIDLSAVTVPLTVRVQKLTMQASGSGTKNGLFNFAGTNADLKFIDTRMESAYVGGAFSFLFMGGGTLTRAAFERCVFLVTAQGAFINYISNMTPTAARGIKRLKFHQCEFDNESGASINALLVRGFDGLTIDDCTFINMNNSVVPDNIFQKNNLRFINNEEVYTVSGVNCEGFDIMGCTGIICTNNQQRSEGTRLGTDDVGGILIDTAAGLVTSGVTVMGNEFFGNPIQLAPQNGAKITDLVIKGNTINATRTTANVNSGIVMGTDSGTSARIEIEGNTITGSFNGNPVNKGSGYNDNAVRFGPNFGWNPDTLHIVAFAASYTFDMSVGVHQEMTLTAAVTAVNAPISSPAFGQRITMTFIQDGTGGRAVGGWNAIFKQSWSDTGNTLGKRSSIAFIFDGTNWNQDGAQTPYV